MPYYKIKHILFIHIPKTGGTMLNSLLKKDDIQLIYQEKYNNNIFPPPFDKYSLQHQFYSTIYKYKNLYNLKFNNKLKIISIVRNPYTRIISDLFWFTKLGQYNFIKKNYTKEQIYQSIKTYLKMPPQYLDNHNTPQYKYITDNHDNLISNIKIFKLENLYKNKENINKYLNCDLNIENLQMKDYNNYLNKESINLINTFYKKDFEIFKYAMNYEYG